MRPPFQSVKPPAARSAVGLLLGAPDSGKAGLCRLILIGLCATGLLASCAGGEAPSGDLPPVPSEYAGKRMPEGWWTDPKIIEEGKRLYMGGVDAEVDCAKCHGRDGKPVKRGARDFTASDKMSRFSDSFWFWRVSEGVPRTNMKAWKAKLTEEQRWKVIAFEHTFSHGGQPSPHDDYKPPVGAGP